MWENSSDETVERKLERLWLAIVEPGLASEMSIRHLEILIFCIDLVVLLDRVRINFNSIF
jgi:hypothetical protein